MKIHYNSALHPERSIVFACKIGGPWMPATTDPELVTCGNCKRRMGSEPKRPEPYPVPAVVYITGKGELAEFKG